MADAALAEAQAASSDKWAQHDPHGFLAGEVAHVQTARAFLRDVLGSVTVLPGNAPTEERVVFGGPLKAATATKKAKEAA